MKRAGKLLVVVDMQHDFIDGALGTPEARRILPRVTERVRAARLNGETVVFTRDTHEEDYLSTQEGERLPVVHCVRGTRGWQLAEGLAADGERVFDKPAFGSTELARFAAEGAFAEAELIGVCTDICVISNAMTMKAFAPEMVIAVDAACCAGVTPESHRTALKAMKSCQIHVVNEGKEPY